MSSPKLRGGVAPQIFNFGTGWMCDHLITKPRATRRPSMHWAADAEKIN
jgi:hypothetical protein